MSADSNKEIVRRFYDSFNQGSLDGMEEIIDPGIVVHSPLTGDMQGAEAFGHLGSVFLNGFPGSRTEIQALVGEGDLVAALHTHEGIQSGPFLGIPPTGKHALIEGIELFRIANGKIVEFWRHDDDAGLLVQLGVLPVPGGGG